MAANTSIVKHKIYKFCEEIFITATKATRVVQQFGNEK